jgi:biopolymer transport protein ExbB
MFYRYFRGKVDEYTLQLELSAERLLPHLTRFQVKPAAPATPSA